MRLKAFVSLYHEHGIFVKDQIMEKLGNPDIVVAELETATAEKVFKFSKLNVENEAKMLLSLFDALVNQHYYFLTEFEFTENLSWKPNQYDYLSEIHPAFQIEKRKKEYKAFRELYSIVEDLFISMNINLRSNGVDPYDLFINVGEFRETVNEISKIVGGLIKTAYEDADIVIGCGTFFSIVNLPIDIAFRVSGVDVGQFSYTIPPRTISVNPFMFYWLISSIFEYNKSSHTVSPKYILLNIIALSKTAEFLDSSINLEEKIKELRIHTYSPSVIVSKLKISTDRLATDVKKQVKKNLLQHKPIVFWTDVLFPFSYPSVVKEVKFTRNVEAPPFVDSTPYGQVIYEIFAYPKITKYTKINVELFNNPLYNKELPLILDTNVIDAGTFPYSSNSPFFRAFMMNRRIIIPSVVLYELMRKLEFGKEKQKVIRALVKLQNYNSVGLIKLEISSEVIPFEMATHEILTELSKLLDQTSSKRQQKRRKSARSDIRDVLILQYALRTNGIVFTNDKKLKTLAILLGVPTISYNPLIDDIKMILQQICKDGKIKKKELIKRIKEYEFETRGEEYSDEEIELVLGYLRIVDKNLSDCIE